MSLALEFSEGLGTVELNKRQGYVDREGKLVIPPKFLWAHAFPEGLAAVDTGTGKPISPFPMRVKKVLSSQAAIFRLLLGSSE
jgi:hypothetical protein